MKKAVIYARVSSTIERNRQNTERQVADLMAYAEYANLEVVEVFEEYISGGKRNDERAILQDAIEYIKDKKNMFDIILIDSTDPMGPGEGLFTEEFYTNVKRSLKKGGIVAAQSESPFVNKEEIKKIDVLLNNRSR